MSLAIIQWSLVAEVIAVSFVAGTVVIALFATVILGSTRAADARRAGQGTAVAWTGLAAVALLAFTAVLVLAIFTMVNKG